MSAKVAKNVVKNGGNAKMGSAAKKSAPSTATTTTTVTESRTPINEASQTLSPPSSEDDVATNAENFKIKGNEFYKQGDYKQAIECYSAALELQPNNASYYGNRAASYMMVNQYQEAAQDSARSVELDCEYTKGFVRLARCNVALGELQRAQDNLKHAITLEPANDEAKRQIVLVGRLQNSINEAEARHSSGDHRTALFMLERALEQMPAAYHLRFRRAEFLVLLRRYQEAKEVAEELMRFKSHNSSLSSNALWLRGHCLYYMDQPEKAMEHWTQVLRLEPDHVRAAQDYRQTKRLLAAKEEGNAHVAGRRWNEAVDAYNRALTIDSENGALCAKLYCNRAHAFMQMKKFEEALKDCDKAIQLDERYVKAFLRRAKCFETLERWEEAVRDHEKVLHIAPSNEQRQQLRAAKLELKKSKRKDYYKVLGVSKDATDDDIRKAYRKAALVHHPDRHTNADEAQRKEEERKFKEVGEAYAVLSDAQKRRRYDAGHDIEDLDGMQGGGGMHGFGGVDPNEIFRMFFSGGGGGGQHFQNGGGGGSQFSFSFG